MEMFGIEFYYSTLFLVITLISVILYTMTMNAGITNSKRMPPGPTPFPIIGNAHLFVGKRDDEVHSALAKKYGDIFTISVGPTKFVVLNSYEVMKEAFQRDEFLGRPVNSVRLLMNYPINSGVMVSQGSIWKSNRRFCLRNLRDLGFGKTSFEPRIMEEVQCFTAALRKQIGQPLDITDLLTNAISNVICRMVFGKRYEYENPEFLEIARRIGSNARVPYFLFVLDFTNNLPFVRNRVQQSIRNVNFLKSFLAKHVDEHKMMFNAPTTQGDDMINVYLQGKDGLLDTENTIDQTIFKDDHINKVILDLLAAGTETTTTTLRWALLYMVSFPDIQDKVRAEIRDVIGSDRPPRLSDKNNLRYTQAVMTEVQRASNVVYLSLPHATTCDVEFRGYTIPANTPIVSNLPAVNLNERDFPNPRMFRPERFIDDKGNFKKNLADTIVPFGIGKRLCLGEALAKMELFLYFTTMIQQFIFKTPDGVPVPSLEGTSRIINAPEPFLLSVANAL